MQSHCLLDSYNYIRTMLIKWMTSPILAVASLYQEGDISPFIGHSDNGHFQALSRFWASCHGGLPDFSWRRKSPEKSARVQSAHRHGSRTWELQHWVCEVVFFMSKFERKHISQLWQLFSVSLFCSEISTWEGQSFLVKRRRSSSSCGVIHSGTSTRQWRPGQRRWPTWLSAWIPTWRKLALQRSIRQDRWTTRWTQAKPRVVICTENTSEGPQDAVMIPIWVKLTWKLLSSNGTSARTTQGFPNTQLGVLRVQLKSPLVSICTIILLYLHVVCTHNIASWSVVWLKVTCALVFAFGKWEDSTKNYKSL